jgi:hypothetical protein
MHKLTVGHDTEANGTSKAYGMTGGAGWGVDHVPSW